MRWVTLYVTPSLDVIYEYSPGPGLETAHVQDGDGPGEVQVRLGQLSVHDAAPLGVAAAAVRPPVRVEEDRLVGPLGVGPPGRRQHLAL